MDSYKDKRKSEKDVKDSRKSNPENGENNLHLDDEQKESKPNSKGDLTSAEFIALKVCLFIEKYRRVFTHV